MPYQAIVVALHLGVAVMVFRLVERRSGAAWALVAGTLVAFFGSGFENVFWGFQTGFVGSVLLGLIAVDLSDRPPSLRRAWLVAAILIMSLMCSGTGVAMTVLVGVAWAIDPGWRRYVGILALPATAYAAWLAAFGRSGVATMRNPMTLEALSDVPSFVLTGLGNAATAATGLGSVLGIAVALGTVAWAGTRLARGALPPVAGGAIAAVVLQYALIGLVRGGLFDGQVHYSRYTYTSGILFLLALSDLARHPVRPTRRVPRAIVTASAISIVLLAFTLNGALLVQGRELFLSRADMTRALIVAGLTRPLPTSTDPNWSLVLVPSPASLKRIVEAYGDPRLDALVPQAVRPVPTGVREAARRVRDGAPVPRPTGTGSDQ